MKKSFITGIFMIGFLAASAMIAFTGIWTSRSEVHYKNLESVIKGQWSSVYEDVFNQKVYTYDWCKNGWGLVTYLLYREGKKGVLVGADNWLFTSEEFEHKAEDQKRLQQKIDFIAAVKEQLAAKNAELLVVPVPSKARVYKSDLGRYKFPSYKEPVYKEFLSGLERRQVRFTDTLSSLNDHNGKNRVFLKTDTHWTPEGARQTARAAALYINQNIPGLSYDPVAYVTKTEREEIHKGDLLSYIPVGAFASSLDIQPDRIRIVQTIKEDAQDNDTSAEALFSDNTPAITLVGTSYSANAKWNFDGYLREFLQADVLNSAKEGMGPFETMKKYLTDQAFLETPPKLVIWEIPERYLTFDYDLKTDFYPGV